MGRRRALDSIEAYERAIKNGMGLGDKGYYKPWIRVQDVNSRGTSAKIHGIKANRTHHLLSQLEKTFFHLAEFSSSVVDIREQFPLLPLKHSCRIAECLGIKHPIVPGTKTPNVLTTDFLITKCNSHKNEYIAVSVKPKSELIKPRVLEKLEIEKVWWELLGVPFYIFTSNDKAKTQAKFIAWLTSSIRHNDQVDSELIGLSIELLDIGLVPLKEIINIFEHSFSIKEDKALILFKYLVFNRIIEIDLNCSPLDSDTIIITKIHKIKALKYGS